MPPDVPPAQYVDINAQGELIPGGEAMGFGRNYRPFQQELKKINDATRELACTEGLRQEAKTRIDGFLSKNSLSDQFSELVNHMVRDFTNANCDLTQLEKRVITESNQLSRRRNEERERMRQEQQARLEQWRHEQEEQQAGAGGPPPDSTVKAILQQNQEQYEKTTGVTPLPMAKQATETRREADQVPASERGEGKPEE